MDKDFEKELKDIYISSNQEFINQLRAPHLIDEEKLKFIIHKLKGSSAVAGVSKIVKSCKLIEIFIQNKEVVLLDKEIEILILEFKKYKG